MCPLPGAGSRPARGSLVPAGGLHAGTVRRGRERAEGPGLPKRRGPRPQQPGAGNFLVLQRWLPKVERYGLAHKIEERHFFPTVGAAVAAFCAETGSEWAAPPAATPPDGQAPAAAG